MLDWPVQVREELRDEITTNLSTRGGSVQVIRGDAGVGKTTLATAVAGRLAKEGYTVLPVIGVRELSGVPLAAMTPLLALGAGPADLPVTERMQRLFTTVTTAGKKYVLVIDDGPLLDDVSASAVYQLIRIYGLRCVMTARRDDEFVGALARLFTDGVVVTTEVEGISDAQATRAVEGALGGRVEPESLKRLLRMAGGNPLYLREIVLAAESRRAVHEGSHGLTVDDLHLPERIRDVIAARLAKLQPDERRLMEIVSVAEPIPSTAIDHRILADLDARSLLDDTSRGVYLSHPLFADVLTAELSDAELDERRIEAAAVLGEPATDDERFKALSLRADTASPPPAAELAWGSLYAGALDDHRVALHLANRALAIEPSFDGFVARAMALSWLGRLEDAEAEFDRAETAIADDDDRARLAIERGIHVTFRRGDPTRAMEAGENALALIADPVARERLETNIVRWRLVLLGWSPEFAVTAPTSEDIATALSAAVLLAMQGMFEADIEATRTTLEHGRSLLPLGRIAVPHAEPVFAFVNVILNVYEGRIDDARALATALQVDTLSPASGVWLFGGALVELHAGRMTECHDLSAAAVERLRWMDFAGLLGPAIALQASAAARLGNVTEARELLAQLTETMLSSASLISQMADVEAWSLARTGDPDGAAALIAAAADELNRARNFGIAAPTAAVAVRIGRGAAVLESLRLAAAAAPGPFIDAILAHAEAAVAQSPDALMAAATALGETGQLGAAVDAADLAGTLFRAARNAEGERKAGLLAARWSGQVSGLRIGQGVNRTFELTERELVIARAAAGRERSREIAERLGLSARTVDNHLSSIYRKLGIAGRDELRGHLGTLLEP